jgi:hypothetical protein
LQELFENNTKNLNKNVFDKFMSINNEHKMEIKNYLVKWFGDSIKTIESKDVDEIIEHIANHISLCITKENLAKKKLESTPRDYTRQVVNEFEENLLIEKKEYKKYLEDPSTQNFAKELIDTNLQICLSFTQIFGSFIFIFFIFFIFI